jgi:hypothetical protein
MTHESQTSPEDTNIDLWEETVDPETGKSSLTIHTPHVVWTGCKPDNCYLVETDNPRIKQCKHCKAIKPFIIGYHKLDNGVIKPLL